MNTVYQGLRSNRMHFQWIVLGRSPSALDLVDKAIKAKAVAPEDVCIFTEDANRETYTESQLNPPFRPCHPLLEVRPECTLTHSDFKSHTLYFYDKADAECNQSDKAYSYDKLILSPEPWLNDSETKKSLLGYQRFSLTDDIEV